MRVAEALEDSVKNDRPVADPSITSSLERLISGSQGVITKRLDLVLLEAQELLASLLERSVLAGVAVLLAAGAWFAAAAALALLIAPDGRWLLRLVVVGLMNAAGAYWLINLAQRSTPSSVPPQTRRGGGLPVNEPVPAGAGK